MAYLQGGPLNKQLAEVANVGARLQLPYDTGMGEAWALYDPAPDGLPGEVAYTYVGDLVPAAAEEAQRGT